MEELDIDSLDFGGSGSGGGGAGGGSGASMGIEFLINDSKKSMTKADIDLADLDDLEKELSGGGGGGGGGKSGGGGGGNGGGWSFFGGGEDTDAAGMGSSRAVDEPEEFVFTELGDATSKTHSGRESTWDGFSKLSDAALSSGGSGGGGSGGSGGGFFSSFFGGSSGGNSSGGSRAASSSNGPAKSQREKIRDKKRMLRRIQEWHSKGNVKSEARFTMDTPYEEIEDEYEACLEEKRRKDSLKLQQWWIITAVNTIEYTNSKFDPFGLNLEGWGEQVSEDIDSYEDILAELYEKYKGGKLAPEVNLLLKLVFSAVMVNITNQSLSSAVPSVGDIIRQSPDLLRAFTASAAETMSSQPGGGAAAGFMNSVLGSAIRPPPPMETQGPNAPPPPPRPGAMGFGPSPGISGMRPDLAAARGGSVPPPQPPPMFRDRGVNLQTNNEVRVDAPERSRLGPSAPPSGPGVAIRREMSGPSQALPSISELLSMKPGNGGGGGDGNASGYPISLDVQTLRDEDSMVSISSLRELQDSTKMPTKARKRRGEGNKRSATNTVSLTNETSLSL